MQNKMWFLILNYVYRLVSFLINKLTSPPPKEFRLFEVTGWMLEQIAFHVLSKENKWGNNYPPGRENNYLIFESIQEQLRSV